MKMFIHGEERDSRDSAVIEVVNPYNGKLLDTVPAATREDVTECITWAVEGQKTWNQKNIREKSEVLKKFVGLVKEKREDLARLLTMETGKPIGDSYGEVDELCYIFEGSIEVMKHHYGKTMPRGTQPGYDTDLQVTVYEPRNHSLFAQIHILVFAAGHVFSIAYPRYISVFGYKAFGIGFFSVRGEYFAVYKGFLLHTDLSPLCYLLYLSNNSCAYSRRTFFSLTICLTMVSRISPFAPTVLAKLRA